MSSPGSLAVSIPASAPGGAFVLSPPLTKAHFTGRGAHPTSGALCAESDTWEWRWQAVTEFASTIAGKGWMLVSLIKCGRDEVGDTASKSI